ncbi:MAG: winged helix-turn-helix domain-containing protein [Candidatus Bathyarchaeota archaeon]|nr:winged helix-turn-helix domain-containing protein [Candidatus Bathyarchaeota archaeon]
MNYRTKLDIIADILAVARRDAKRTQIMYQANLSYKVLVRYLNEVVASSLISFEHEQQCYRLTEKGKKFLVVYREYVKSNKGVEKRLDYVRKKKHDLEELCKSQKLDSLTIESA